ncbi:MAG: primosomal protein N' [Acidobacteriota bacterium]
MKRYFQIALPLPIRQTFTYSLQESISADIRPGTRVIVPFGRREMVGFITEEIEEEKVGLDKRKVKEIIRILDERPLMSEDILTLSRWAADYYICGLGEMLKAAIPGISRSSKTKVERCAEIVKKEGWSLEDYRRSCGRAIRQLAVLELLLEEGKAVPFSEIKEKSGASSSTVLALSKKGLLSIGMMDVRRKPFSLSAAERKEIVLNDEQERAVRELYGALEMNQFKVFLLKGVTGSGKTEVYLKAMEKAISMERNALYLVPEISLTPMLAREITGRFGKSVSILHSALTPGERYDEWMRVKNGKAKIVLGARSAIFAPLSNLGIIVIDEEQDHSYKQEESPRYNARDLAIVRAKNGNIPVVMGSATPSLESYFHAIEGKYRLLELRSRVEKRALPEVVVVDMKEEYRKKGETVPVSDALFEKITQKVQAGEQALVLLNRRGFSSFVQCRECGTAIVCPRCNISLTYHKADERLLCHYCGYWKKEPDKCPSCKSNALFYGGEGTEKVEEAIQETLKSFRVARMDRDTVKGRGGHARILGAFEKKEIDLLVGTQMIAKGHDFPSVTLVGVISADRVLTLPDFRASERTFQLLTQVAGRAGRGEIPGLVLIQAFQSGHYAIQAAIHQDFEGFYEKEIRFRKVMQYPPFTVMANVIVQDKNLSRGASIAKKAGRIIKNVSDGKVIVLGPAVAPLSKIKKRYRFQIILKAKSRREIGNTLNRFLEAGKDLPLRNIIIDVDPISLM